MEPNKKFPSGINFDRPRDGAPDFVKGRMGVNLQRLIAWAAENNLTDEWINFDLLQSKDGAKLYFSLNDWKKTATTPSVRPQEPQGEEIAPQGDVSAEKTIEYPKGEPDEINF
jgi:hypothetical protein